MAIRMACRHFNFFCVSNHVVMLYVSIFSSASFKLLFVCSIQSSKSSSWLAVLVLYYSGVFSLISSSRMSCSPHSFFLVLSFRLDDESEHSALRSAEHFFVLPMSPLRLSVGVTTASNRCDRCRGKYDWDVSSCRCLANADQAHRIL